MQVEIENKVNAIAVIINKVMGPVIAHKINAVDKLLATAP